MNIYHFNPETGAFLGVGTADPSPLEEGVWLIPAHATAEQPPTPTEGQQAVFVAGAWQLQEIPAVPEPEPEIEPQSVDPSVLRFLAFQREADPLFFKAQRGEATIEEWQAKVTEIRSRYPYSDQEVI